MSDGTSIGNAAAADGIVVTVGGAQPLRFSHGDAEALEVCRRRGHRGAAGAFLAEWMAMAKVAKIFLHMTLSRNRLCALL